MDKRKLPKTEEHKRKISESHKGMKKPWVSKFNKKKSKIYIGEKHRNWKGDKVGYGGLHMWIAKELGKPKYCEHCKCTNLRSTQYNWANKSRQYKRDVTDWVRLCNKCHKKYDKESIHRIESMRVFVNARSVDK